MTNSPQEALDIYNSWTYNEPGMCLKECRTAYDIPSKYSSALEAWNHCKYKHSGDRTPPTGAPVYWSGGSSGYGHIAIYAGNGNVRSTDAGGSGKMGTKPLDWFTSHWGLPYAGWAEDINGVRIPGLEPEDEDVAISDADADKIASAVWNKIKTDADGDEKATGTLLVWAYEHAKNAKLNTDKLLDQE